MFDEIIYIERIKLTTKFVVSEFSSLLKISTGCVRKVIGQSRHFVTFRSSCLIF